MKVHAGVDAGTGYVHTITGTAANIHDIDETIHLLREDDEVYIVIPDTVEPKTDQRFGKTSISGTSTSRRMSSLQISRFHPAIKGSTGIRKSRIGNPLYDAKWSIRF